ncbi:phage major capsid protein [Leuconostoc mesenteroides]|uniref:phage major capsid protein n=1 Tax=Leuconostoc mesenteroides TaxID=1245 RepID=UPI001CC113C5|nr:phage major capsid protein [Leuconostoc mesenteroides]MBZ1518817.1 phage major capsid protein [Leuconostoc mesenteroides]MBZ1520352.1 phage major capsid protein [Leuconostoc mesenteroides]
MDKEIRSIQGDIHVVQRDNSDDPKQIQGYAVLFNTESVDLGGFIEVIKPNALDNVDLSAVQLIYGHENNSILARVDSGNLTLTVDETGLFFVAALADTNLANDVYQDILAGNLKGMSFGFTIPEDGDDWIFDQGDTAVHVVNQIGDVIEITITPNPAYQDTSVSVKRSLDEARKDKENMNEAEIVNTVKKLLEERDAAQVKPADEKTDKSSDEKPDDKETSSKEKRDDAVEEQPDEPEERSSVKENTEKRDTMPKVIKNEPVTERSNFKKFLKRDLSITGGTTASDNSLAIPKDILQPIERPANTNSLISLANVISVSAPAGTVPVMSATDIVLATAAELAENPQIAKLQLTGVDYKLVTKRGYIPVSQEFIDDADADVNVDTLIGDYATQIRDNTLVKDIAGVLKTATPATVTSFDDVKKTKNALFKYGNISIVATKSAFDVFDTLKDNEGRYLLQDSISSPSGKQLLGSPVYVVEDKLLGAKDGDKVVFVGDVKSFTIVPLYKDLRAKWTDNDVYGQKLQLVIRDDAKVADADAGKLLTLNITQAGK